MAEAIARKVAIERGLSDVEVSSAGTSAWEGAPASDGALLVSMERGMDLNEHRAQNLTRDLVRSHDIILAMGPHHLERIEALGGEGKAFLISDYSSRGASHRPISDPVGAELDVYRATADATEYAIYDALFSAKTMTGKGGVTVYGLPGDRVMQMLHAAGAIK